MTGKATNLALLMLLVLQLATGIGAFLAASPRWSVVLWLHASGGFSVVLLFYWKRRIIFRSLGRRPLGVWAVPSLALLTLVLGVLATGIGWSTVGLPALAGYPAMTFHVALAVGLMLFMALHAAMHWPRVRPVDLVGRRSLLRSGALLLGGAVLWRGSEGASSLLGLSGPGRRFTGSRRATSFSGNDFPVSNWLFDDPSPLDREQWRLRVGGHVVKPFELALEQLEPAKTVNAVLDCTGGWYTEQEWRGIGLASLLSQAGVRSGAASVVVRASTGYWRRYTLAEAGRALLATHAGDSPLSHEHGAPLRLILPGKRGYEWVKWVTSIEVSTASPLLKWPLPIS